MLFQKFLNIIEKDDIIKENDCILVAVSGGADSVCLLHLMHNLSKKIPFHLICAHLNHGLRAEADEDEAFVKKLCANWNVSFVSQKSDIKRIAETEKISIELAGRKARYRFFDSVKCDLILTAHTKNDNTETIFLHMLRGCGTKGLCGIPKFRNNKIYRPLLDFSREEIEAYLKAHKISWRTDKSNNELIYTRNIIRHKILPSFIELNPSFVDTLSRMTSVISEESEYLDSVIDEVDWVSSEGEATIIHIETFLKMPKALQKRALSRILECAEEVESVLMLFFMQNGKRISLSDKRIAEKDYDDIVIYKSTFLFSEEVKLPLEGQVTFGNYTITVGEEGLLMPRKEYTVRCRRNGDKFSPEGILGHKKLKDFFCDEKIPRRFRDEFPIITHNGKIAAIGDLRRDNAFTPTGDETIHIKITRNI